MVVASIVLIGLAGVLAIYKTAVLGYQLDDVLPRTKYTLNYRIGLDGRGHPARVRAFLPVSDERQDVVDEVNDSKGMHFSASMDNLNKAATWSSPEAPRGTEINYKIDVLTRATRYDIEPDLPIPAKYPETIVVVLALNLLLGRWTGVRLSEYIRFRKLLLSGPR